MNAITRRERLVFVVRIDVAVLPHAVVGATGGFLGVEHVVEERFGESARRGADVDARETGFENVDGDGFGGIFVAEEGDGEGRGSVGLPRFGGGGTIASVDFGVEDAAGEEVADARRRLVPVIGIDARNFEVRERAKVCHRWNGGGGDARVL